MFPHAFNQPRSILKQSVLNAKYLKGLSFLFLSDPPFKGGHVRYTTVKHINLFLINNEENIVCFFSIKNDPPLKGACLIYNYNITFLNLYLVNNVEDIVVST